MSELVAKTSPAVIASVDTKVPNEAVYALLPTALADIIKKMKPTTPPATSKTGRPSASG
jgi:hypothetical protein